MTGKVLVIDDESVTRRVVIHTLKTINIEVLGAADGQEGIALAAQNHFDLAIVDINLPDIDGFEVMQQLKAMPHMQNAPMIIFTARNQQGDKARAQEFGASAFLFKPFSTQELRDLVLAHISGI